MSHSTWLYDVGLATIRRHHIAHDSVHWRSHPAGFTHLQAAPEDIMVEMVQSKYDVLHYIGC